MINNNDIMKKLRVALKLRDTDIIEILKLADFEISASELSAIFRTEGHPHFRPCGDQILRRFLDGLIIRNRGPRQGPRPSAGQLPGNLTERKHRPLKPSRPWSEKPNDTIRVYRADGV